MRRRIGARDFDFSREVAVMAIVNRTPDSFHDRGATFALDRAVEAALRAIDDGADWVDIGGVPFGRGPAVGLDEELDRVVPLAEAIAARSDVVISIDTFNATVAEAAIAAGAAVINDTSGLHDPAMASVVGSSDATLVLTHSLGEPRNGPAVPVYTDVVADVVEKLRSLVARAVAEGVPAERLVLDPGHDLNKNTRHTLELTRRLDEVVELGMPTLVALSNKDFIGESLGREQHDRLAGSLAAAVFCIVKGARIVRVHDVRATVDAVRMTEAILGWRDPVYEKHNV